MPSLAVTRDRLFQLPAAGKIYVYLEDFNAWHVLDNNPATTKIAVDNGKDVYLMNNLNEIWAYSAPQTKWVKIDKNADSKSIVAGNGQLYQIHTEGSIWAYDTVAVKWNLIDNNNNATALAVDGTSLYQMYTDGEVWRYNGASVGGWTLVGNNIDTKSIAAGGGNLYQMHNDGSVWRYDTVNLWVLIDNNSNTLQIAAGQAGLFQRHEDKVYKYAGNSTWTVILNGVLTEDLVVGDTMVYVKNATGIVSRYKDGVWFNLPALPSN